MDDNKQTTSPITKPADTGSEGIPLLRDTKDGGKVEVTLPTIDPETTGSHTNSNGVAKPDKFESESGVGGNQREIPSVDEHNIELDVEVEERERLAREGHGPYDQEIADRVRAQAQVIRRVAGERGISPRALEQQLRQISRAEANSKQDRHEAAKRSVIKQQFVDAEQAELRIAKVKQQLIADERVRSQQDVLQKSAIKRTSNGNAVTQSTKGKSVGQRDPEYRPVIKQPITKQRSSNNNNNSVKPTPEKDHRPGRVDADPKAKRHSDAPVGNSHSQDERATNNGRGGKNHSQFRKRGSGSSTPTSTHSDVSSHPRPSRGRSAPRSSRGKGTRSAKNNALVGKSIADGLARLNGERDAHREAQHDNESDVDSWETSSRSDQTMEAKDIRPQSSRYDISVAPAIDPVQHKWITDQLGQFDVTFSETDYDYRKDLGPWSRIFRRNWWLYLIILLFGLGSLIVLMTLYIVLFKYPFFLAMTSGLFLSILSTTTLVVILYLIDIVRCVVFERASWFGEGDVSHVYFVRFIDDKHGDLRTDRDRVVAVEHHDPLYGTFKYDRYVNRWINYTKEFDVSFEIVAQLFHVANAPMNLTPEEAFKSYNSAVGRVSTVSISRFACFKGMYVAHNAVIVAHAMWMHMYNASSIGAFHRRGPMRL